MVAIINTGPSIRSIFNYNENKVSSGVAQCIGEGNYPVDADKMSRTFKLNLLLKQLELNPNVTRNSVHISLNFDPSEKELSKEKLMEIASVYMSKIGFGAQPYLVYQHHDAGHPHIHIVSIKVKADGKRIDMQNIGRNQSENARKEIEKSFSLVRAESKKNKTEMELTPLRIHKIQYGTADSKKAIAGVLSAVISHYKYSSMAELNAILNLYNVCASRGREDSKMFLHKGLVYQIMDADKKPLGVPIKASNFYFKPTLKFLEEKFKENKTRKVSDKRRVTNAIDKALFIKNSIPLTQLAKSLEKEGIHTVLRTSSEGLLYGITYVDHTTKNVFNGSSLGKQYSAKAIEQRCAAKKESQEKANQTDELHRSEQTLINNLESQKNTISIADLVTILSLLTQAKYSGDYIPNQFKKKKNKRRKRVTGY